MILGAHVSVAGGVQNAPLNAQKIGCDAIQMFAKNQTQWKAKPYTEENISGFKANFKEADLQSVVIHDSYLINLCATDENKLRMSIEAYVDELERAESLGIPYVVTHPGSHLGKGEEWGIAKIAESLDEIHERCAGFKVVTLLETTAGQGTNLGYRFEHLAGMRGKVKEQQRVGFCIDTCHMYSAGYDLKTKDGYEDTWKKFGDLIGFEHLKAAHLNDSKKEFGSRVDRHEELGEGTLGLEPFRWLVNDDRFADLPGLLETPGEIEDFKRNLQRLRSLIE
ncbi:deoxyribonuclease IV [bacterium]|nr:deoxyribonuclease IV [bacterium]MBU1652272.1 deoxyribonuclease IV [bacterium]MBU1882161.1 deoxyribonuclease IV [bacterium]